MDSPSVQERYAPHNACFGCGPKNAEGLRIRSFEQGDELVCEWTPTPRYLAFDQVLNGGILGTLLDCHSNWAAAVHLMRRGGLDAPPCTVTADYHVTLRRPTPLAPLRIVARIAGATERRVTVEAYVEAEGETTATCTGTFVTVREGHPAFHRW